MDYEIESRTLDVVDTAVESTTLDIADIGEFLGRAYGEVASYLERKGAGPAGMPFARYHPLGEGRFDIEAGFPASTPVGGEDEIEPSELPGGLAAVTMHIGPYDQAVAAYTALEKWIREQGGTPDGDAWEIYFDDPMSQPDPDQWRTEIVQPYRVP